jgi:dTDP-4-dehydrorhamnose 3,5-epimerase
VAVLIPSGVAHGYQVLGHKPVMLFYHVTTAYDPKNPDEERIGFDDTEIGFDWSIKNR